MFEKNAKYFPIQTETACQRKWNWSTLWLTQGHTASCHRVNHVSLPLDEFDNFWFNRGSIHPEEFVRGSSYDNINLIKNLEIEGLDMENPDYSKVWFSYGEDCFGYRLSEEDLNDLRDENPDFVKHHGEETILHYTGFPIIGHVQNLDTFRAVMQSKEILELDSIEYND